MSSSDRTTVIAISGLAYTGKTTLAKTLAERLRWQYVGAGQRFRAYCAQNDLPLDAVPDEVHIDFDTRIRSELAGQMFTVFEGRYLGLFSRGLPGVLRVRVEASFETRIHRCIKEEALSLPSQAIERIQTRDQLDRELAKRLLGEEDFLNPRYFDLALSTDHEEQETCVTRIRAAIRT